MFSKVLHTLICLFTIFHLIQCSTSIRVYRPFPTESPFEVIKTFTRITIVTPETLPNRFAYFSPYLYNTKGLPLIGAENDLLNEYGSLSYLIRKDLSIRPENYPLLIAEGGKIEIKEFLLESIDGCFLNDVNFKLRAEIQIGKRQTESFEYSDQIRSHVTDCILTASSITVVPLIWYVAYTGYRGNREDQMNQLGRNGIEAFFTFLEIQSGYTKKAGVTPNKSVAPPLDPIRDPKIKEIMDTL